MDEVVELRTQVGKVLDDLTELRVMRDKIDKVANEVAEQRVKVGTTFPGNLAELRSKVDAALGEISELRGKVDGMSLVLSELTGLRGKVSAIDERVAMLSEANTAQRAQIANLHAALYACEGLSGVGKFRRTNLKCSRFHVFA